MARVKRMGGREEGWFSWYASNSSFRLRKMGPSIMARIRSSVRVVNNLSMSRKSWERCMERTCLQMEFG